MTDTRSSPGTAPSLSDVLEWFDIEISAAKEKQIAGFKIATAQGQLAGERAHARQRALYEAKQVVAGVAQAAPDRLPTHGGLLTEINRAAHSAGTNAWVRDVLRRAHRAIRDLAPVVTSTDYRIPSFPDPKTIEACAAVVEDFPETILQMWDRPGGPPGNGYRATTRKDLAAAIRSITPVSSKDRGYATCEDVK